MLGGTPLRVRPSYEREGYLRRQRIGRRDVYSIERTARLRHATEADHASGELLDLFVGDATATTTS